MSPLAVPRAVRRERALTVIALEHSGSRSESWCREKRGPRTPPLDSAYAPPKMPCARRTRRPELPSDNGWLAALGTWACFTAHTMCVSVSYAEHSSTLESKQSCPWTAAFGVDASEECNRRSQEATLFYEATVGFLLANRRMAP